MENGQQAVELYRKHLPDVSLLDLRMPGMTGVEAATDRAAERPWTRLGEAGLAELAEVLTPLAIACTQVVPYPSPIGVPRPA